MSLVLRRSGAQGRSHQLRADRRAADPERLNENRIKTLRRLKNRAAGVFCAPSACAGGAGVVFAASGTRSWPVSRTTEKGKRRKMAGVRKAANSHSSLHCCGCSCSLSGHMILWSRTHLQIGIYRTDNEGALLCTVLCSALRAELGSPFGRAVGAAD